MNRTVIIAAGHGGGDPGATARGTNEATEVIDITNRVLDILRRDGQLTVVHVPNELGLVDSINWVNARYKNLLDGLSVEIHKNSGGGTGHEVWYPSGGDANSRAQAQAIVNQLSSFTGLRNRGIKDAATNRFGRLAWTDDTNTYAQLIECGFIDVDPIGGEANQRYAEGIARGLLAVWGLTLTPPKPTTPTWEAMDNPRKLRAKEDLFVLDLTTGRPVGAVIKKGSDIDFSTKTLWNGVTYLRSVYSTSKGLNYGIALTSLEEIVPVTPVPPVDPQPVNPLDPTDGEDAKTWVQRVIDWFWIMLSKFTYKG